jgi:hypothetical protein
MTTTGKAARKRFGNRHASKRAKAKRTDRRRDFGTLPVSNTKGNGQSYNPARVSTCLCATGCLGIRGGEHVDRPELAKRLRALDRMDEIRGAA